MAEYTATITRIGEAQPAGQYKSVLLSVDVTDCQQDDGLSLTAGSGALSDFRRIVSVEVLNSQETRGLVMQYVPTTMPTDERGVGDGKLYISEEEAVAAGGALVETDSGSSVGPDVGQFMVKVIGF